MIKNILRRHKSFLVGQFPHYLAFIFLFFLLLINGASNKDRLYDFASKPVEYDILGTYIVNDNNLFDAFIFWENRIETEYNNSILNLEQVLSFPINKINGSDYIGNNTIINSVLVLAFSSRYNMSIDQVYAYGSLFSSHTFSVGNTINITMDIDSETTVNCVLKISKILSNLPSFITTYYKNIDNFLIISSNALKTYFSSIKLSDVSFNLVGITSVLFSFNFKNSFLVEEKLEDFITNAQFILNSTIEESNSLPVILTWNTREFLNRITQLRKKIYSDMEFYSLASLPFLILILISIYLTRDFVFNSFRYFIVKLHERGYEKKKIISLFFKIFLLFDFILTLVSIPLFVILSSLFNTMFFQLFFMILTVLLCWILIILITQIFCFNNSIDDFYVSLKKNLDKKVKRKNFKFFLIDFVFKSLITSSFLVAIVSFFKYFYLHSTTFIILISLVLIVYVLSLRAFFENAIRKFISYFNYFLIVIVGKSFLGAIRFSLLKIFNMKKTVSRYYYLVLQILFILAPTLFIVSDSLAFHIEAQHYASVCGDIVFENLTPDQTSTILTFLDANDTVVPAIKWKTSVNITFFFSYPRDFARLIDYSWQKSAPFLSRNETTLQVFNRLSENQNNIIISSSAAESFKLHTGSTLSLFLVKDSPLILNSETVYALNYTVSAVVSEVPYLSTAANYWAFVPLEYPLNAKVGNYGLSRKFCSELIYLNKSLINTIFVRLANPSRLFEVEMAIKSSLPSLKHIVRESREEINALYPVPFEHFRQFITLQLVIALVLELVFFSLTIISIFKDIGTPIISFFSKGIDRYKIFYVIIAFFTSQILVFVIIGVPISIFLSTGLIRILSVRIYIQQVKLRLFRSSLMYLVLFLILLIIMSGIIIKQRFDKVINSVSKFIGEKNE